MPGISGGNQGALLSALTFLKLINTGGVVTEKMRALVTAYGTDQWSDSLVEVLGSAYDPIIGDLDIDTATYKQLSDAFKQRGGVDGQMLDKCIRFFLAAWNSTGSTLSPHFKKPRASRPAVSRAQRRAPRDPENRNSGSSANGGGANGSNPSVPTGYTSFPLRDGRMAIVPANLTKQDAQTISAYLTAFVGGDGG
ncbi:hypothetical protein B7486_03460 [cyanobacterium TDX16]|nr:hypothetical protein B7486_03460 [cyanobacterium TDX16]